MRNRFRASRPAFRLPAASAAGETPHHEEVKVNESITEDARAADETPDAQSVLEATGKSAHAECLVCGQQNPIGFKLVFQAQDDGSVRAPFTCKLPLQSYPETLHGGVVSALLDAAMTNCLFSKGIVAVTAELTVRFLNPVRLDEPAEVTAAISRIRGPLYYLQAELVQGQTFTARAHATFLKRDRVRVAERQLVGEEPHG
jgi:uncharacterized protein (TIGR00369 family)